MFEQAVLTIYEIVWGPILLALLLGTGVFLTLGLKGMTIRKIPYAFRQLLKGRKGSGEGEVTPFNALMTSLSSTVGTGNIAGVATAISLGGPGALFWMWLTALVGMATKYAEAVLAVNYRETDAQGKKVGGPMYYIKNGLGNNWKFLGILFAIFGSLAGFGLANTVQSHEVSKVLAQNYSIPTHYSGIVMAVLVGMVLLGGIKRIGAVAGKLVPFMTIVYVISTVWILASHYEAIPGAIALIMDSAFNGMAATGGFAGAAMIAGLRAGVARGIFSNESGLGSAPIAHAAAETNSPVRQGTIAMLGTFIDTIIICTMTGLVLVASGAWNGDLVGANMTRSVFTSSLPFGDTIFTLSLVLFAFTTMLGWSYYGERCAEFLFGPKVITPYRVLWVVGIYIGTQMEGGIVWKLADILNGMMAFPNLIAVLFLSPVVFKLTREYFAEETEAGEVITQKSD
jgi:AGCS family alanine or glycine:cation symporter